MLYNPIAGGRAHLQASACPLAAGIEEVNAAILALANDGVFIKGIARQLGCSHKLVRRVNRDGTGDVFPTHEYA